jgi:rSAM/selenodomain-associated transferase 2
MPPAPPATALVSVIVPALDEEAALPGTLQALFDQRDAPDFEIVLADGGSRDHTIARFESRVAKGAGRVVRCAVRGRAAQMNAGAAAARGDVFVFLHADTRLPPGGLRRVAEALAQPGTAGGGFALSYVERDRLLGIIAAWATLRSRITRTHYGDQAMFTRRDAFESTGGFEDVPLFEDLRFAKALRRQGRIVTLSPAVITSGRRLLRDGILRTALRFAWLKLRHASGADPRRLAAGYRDVR